MDPSPLGASFLIRIWQKPCLEPGVRGAWVVEIIHIQNRERQSIDSVPALVTFLREQLGAPDLLAPKSGLR